MKRTVLWLLAILVCQAAAQQGLGYLAQQLKSPLSDQLPIPNVNLLVRDGSNNGYFPLFEEGTNISVCKVNLSSIGVSNPIDCKVVSTSGTPTGIFVSNSTLYYGISNSSSFAILSLDLNNYTGQFQTVITRQQPIKSIFFGGTVDNLKAFWVGTPGSVVGFVSLSGSSEERQVNLGVSSDNTIITVINSTTVAIGASSSIYLWTISSPSISDFVTTDTITSLICYNNQLLWGTKTGKVFKQDLLSNEKYQQIQLFHGLNNVSQTFGVHDPNYGASFWTNNSNLARVNTNLRNESQKEYESQVIFEPTFDVVGITLGVESNNIYLLQLDRGFFRYFLSSFRAVECKRDNCSSCIASSTSDTVYCGLCLTTQTCTKRNSQCPNFSNGWIDTTSPCPKISSLDPPLSPTSGTSLVVKADRPIFISELTYKLVFVSSFNKTVNCTFKNPFELTCATSTFPSAGIYNARLFIPVDSNWITYTSDVISFPVYDCSNYGNCSSCLSLDKSRCNWCPLSQRCVLDGCDDMLNINKSDECPQLKNTSPAGSKIQGNDLISVFGKFVQVNLNYTCMFGSKVVTAEFKNSDQLNCRSPNATTPINTSIQVYLGNVPYAPALPFTYYNCSNLNGCNKCMLFENLQDLGTQSQTTCTWCSGSLTCSSDNSCEEYCPEITLVPEYIPLRSIANFKNVSIIGTWLAKYNYTCKFSTVLWQYSSNAILENETRLLCPMPSSPPLTEGEYNIEIFVGGVLYTGAPAVLYVYECASNSTQCSQCKYPVCGWCADSSTCVEQTNCTNQIWIANCPSISDITPKEAPSPTNSISVTVYGKNFAPVKGVSLLKCRWRLETNFTIYTTATVDTDILLKCPSPKINTTSEKANLDITIGEKDVSLLAIPSNYSIEIFDCYINGSGNTCDTCMVSPLDSRCGWCTSDPLCGGTSNCNEENYWLSDSNTQCPVFESISPPSASADGGTALTISGKGFVNVTDLMLGFTIQSDKRETITRDVNVMFVNSTTLNAISPPLTGAGSGSASTTLFINGKPFTPNSLPFSFISNDSGSDNGGKIAGIVVGVVGGVCLLIIIAIIVATIIVMKLRSNSGAPKMKLEEPDYEDIAYGSDTNQTYSVDKSGANKLTALEELLLDMEYVFPVCEITQATEADVVAKSFVYLYADNGRAVELINNFITLEVENSSKEGTLFRSNSMASKMFKTYSKMIGIKYLWKTFSKILNELNYYGSKEKGSDEEDPTSLMTTSMEVDPNKMDVTDNDQINKLQLQLISQKVFVAITRSVSNLPHDFRVICKHLKKTVAAKFPEGNTEYKAIGGFLFLRFLVPAITAPHMYGLFKAPPNQHCQRQLILLSKVLQNLANMVEFGSKEPFMAKMNDFISSNLGPLTNFMDELSNVSSSSSSEEMDMPSNVKQNALVELHRHIVANMKKVNAQLDSQENSAEMKEKLANVIDALGDPAEKN
eukprot:TRINITY_DN1138_c0_g1_i1.p1 TRINITY_DN1138_c0_g1~~TRINITY_DN1138_c0_g1_i1.p1  ORF type:complete len:1456 (+),score=163.65 TRINITY_DN1138_c0_g1_i1:50-4417(+)